MAARRISSAWTTCSGASRCRRGRARSSSPTGPCPSASAGSSSLVALLGCWSVTAAVGRGGGRRERAWAPARARGGAALRLLSLAFVSPALCSGTRDVALAAPVVRAALERRAPGRRWTAGNLEVGDAPALLHPLEQEAKERLPEPALWNPTSRAGGRSWRTAVGRFSPFSLPSYVLPFYTSLAFVAALKLFLAALRHLPARPQPRDALGGALLAGAAFGLNLWLVTWLVYPHASVWALIPLLLWHDRAARPAPRRYRAAPAWRRCRRRCSSRAPGVDLSRLSSPPPLSWSCELEARRADDGLVRRTSAFALAPRGAALAAAAVLPFLELVLRSADLAAARGSADRHDPQALPARLLALRLLGQADRYPARVVPARQGELHRRAAADARRGGARAAPAPPRIALASFAALCLAVTYKVPVIFDVVTALPPFSSGHNNRLPVLALLALALLAGFGLDELSGRAPAPRPRARIAAAILLVRRRLGDRRRHVLAGGAGPWARGGVAVRPSAADARGGRGRDQDGGTARAGWGSRERRYPARRCAHVASCWATLFVALAIALSAPTSSGPAWATTLRSTRTPPCLRRLRGCATSRAGALRGSSPSPAATRSLRT